MTAEKAVLADSAQAAAGWSGIFYRQLRRHPWIGSGLLGCMLLFGWFSGQSLLILSNPGMSTVLGYAVLGGMAGLLATTLGALPALFLQKVSQQAEDGLLGFAAGMMLAASAFSLILPGLASAGTLFGSAPAGSLFIAAAIGFGVLLMLGLDTFTPHEHQNTGPCGPGHQHCPRLWLFVFAIAIHNLPEGMAIGVSFVDADLSVGVPLTSAIAIQDIPEGLAVALALSRLGIKPWLAVLIAAGSGLLEPLGALLGVGLAAGSPLAYPLGLGLAAGAMLFVVSHEVIPETHRNGHQTTATLGLMAGFMLMMVLDTALGTG
jgi:ZIP family zinc transporter